MKSRTIRDAIIAVFKGAKKPMTPEAIYNLIIENDYYEFNTDQPVHVVKTRLRRDCEGLEFTSSSKKKYFQLLSDGTYWLKGKPIPKGVTQKVIETRSELNDELERSYEKYFYQFKSNLLKTLKEILPVEFESFCKNFIRAYGFSDASITRPTKDGGIDGFGKLQIGLTHLEVAFECKRWNNNKLGADIVRKFRGAIPTKCVYGIIFTTSAFSKSARNEAQREDLKPVVLMNGEDLIDFMIKNDFGVGKEKDLTMYVNQIDLALSED